MRAARAASSGAIATLKARTDRWAWRNLGLGAGVLLTHEALRGAVTASGRWIGIAAIAIAGAPSGVESITQ